MPSTFDQRIRYLADEVGRGKIVAGNVVHQPYAADVHEDLYDRHPRGGRAKYLEAPLFEQLPDLMQRIANRVITLDGTDIYGAMIDTAEAMADMVEQNAPMEYSILKYSSNPYVIDRTFELYSRNQTAPFRYDKTEEGS